MSAIFVEGLTKRFGQLTAVDSLTFTIRKGEVFGILGPNGAGKTTTVRMLVCILKPTHGSATIAGYDILKEPEKVKKIIGYLPENPSLYERLSAVENLDFYAELYEIPRNVRIRKIKELLEFFNLSNRKNEKVGTYSKGMKQKLALAIALINDPEILFLDEPTSGLDPKVAKTVRDLISKLAKKEKRTIVLCSHNLAEVEKLCNRVMIINRGKMVDIGTVDELAKTLRDRSRCIVKVKLEEVSKRIIKELQKINYVKSIRVSGNSFLVELEGEDLIPEFAKEVTKVGRLISLNPLKPTLEEVYLGLVGKDENE